MEHVTRRPAPVSAGSRRTWSEQKGSKRQQALDRLRTRKQRRLTNRCSLFFFFFWARLFSLGNLSFLNGWKNPLGLEILTPFGREQLFNLGVSFRTKYGSLLKDGQRPVFRTESQDRMVKSALNFAAGFFGSECFLRLVLACDPARKGTDRSPRPNSSVRGPISPTHHCRGAAVQQYSRPLHDVPERR